MVGADHVFQNNVDLYPVENQLNQISINAPSVYPVFDSEKKNLDKLMDQYLAIFDWDDFLQGNNKHDFEKHERIRSFVWGTSGSN